MNTAVMNPWSIVPSKGGDCLFGFLVRHPELGGGSWAISSPICRRDCDIADTASGRQYFLGDFVPLDELPTEEARVALGALAGRRAISAAARSWLQSCKMARWLDLPPPDRRSPSDVEKFIRENMSRYYVIRTAPPSRDYKL